MYNEAEKALYLESFYHFAKYGLGYKDMVPHVHGPICNGLQDPSTLRKLICIPRGTFKSSIASVAYPIWKQLKANSNLRILIDSQLFTNSSNFLREIRGHYELNSHFINLFGNQVGPVWNDTELILKNRTVIKKEPSMVAGGIGVQKTSQHYDLIIADDLSTYDNCKTREHAQKTIDHYRLYTSLLDPGGELVIIGTRYSELDIIGFIIENELGVEKGDTQAFLKYLNEITDSKNK